MTAIDPSPIIDQRSRTAAVQRLRSFSLSGPVHAFGPLPVTDSLGLDPTNACSQKHGYPLTGSVDISENIDLISASEISPFAACSPAC